MQMGLLGVGTDLHRQAASRARGGEGIPRLGKHLRKTIFKGLSPEVGDKRQTGRRKKRALVYLCIKVDWLSHSSDERVLRAYSVTGTPRPRTAPTQKDKERRDEGYRSDPLSVQGSRLSPLPTWARKLPPLTRWVKGAGGHDTGTHGTQFLPLPRHSETYPHHTAVCLTGGPVLAVKPTRDIQKHPRPPPPAVRGTRPSRLSQALRPSRILGRQWPDARSLPGRLRSRSNGPRRVPRRKGTCKGCPERRGRRALPRLGSAPRGSQHPGSGRGELQGDSRERSGWAPTTATRATSCALRQRDGQNVLREDPNDKKTKFSPQNLETSGERGTRRGGGAETREAPPPKGRGTYLAASDATVAGNESVRGWILRARPMRTK